MSRFMWAIYLLVFLLAWSVATELWVALVRYACSP